MEHWRHIFLGVVGHDLRTPLNAVALTAEMLRRQLAGPSKAQAQLLSRAVKRIGAMLDSLLDYANSQIGTEMQLSTQSADLAQACEEEIELLQAAHPGADIRARYGQSLQGVFDVSRLREALSNLVANAVQHGTQKSVDVLVDRQGDEFVISVGNAGEIPEAQRQGLFQPLKRGGSFKTGHRTNLGLGLFICQQIAAAHGGSITARSEAGRVTMTMRWPCNRRVAGGA